MQIFSYSLNRNESGEMSLVRTGFYIKRDITIEKKYILITKNNTQYVENKFHIIYKHDCEYLLDRL